MNFYPFHIGDYLTATRHLTWDEDLAYRRLIDVYYTRESPLPLDKKQVYRLVLATEARQRAAVDTILSEFFTEEDDGLHNARCDEELAALSLKRNKAKQSANARWNRDGARQSQSEGNANASDPHMRTHSEGYATNTNTNTNTNKDAVLRDARDPIPDLEAKLREAAGWQNEPAPNLAVTGQIEALIANGCDLDLDVLPIIRAFAPRVRSRTNWKYFIGPIQQSRDDRIAASSPVNTEIPNVSRRMNGNGSHQTTAGRNPKPSAAQEMRDALADLDGSGTITGF